MATAAPRLTIAYISRERDLEHNHERHEEARASRALCTARAWRDRFIEMYSARQQYTHVEIVFPLDSLTPDERAKYRVKTPKGFPISECVLAFAAFSDRGVTVMARPFTNKGYQFREIQVTRDQVNRALAFALKQVGRPYDSVGASWRLLVWPSAPTRERWWCASLTHAILQRVGVLKNYPLNTLDVDDIVHLVKQSSRAKAGTTPHGLSIAKRSVEAQLFDAYPSRNVAGEIAHDVIDAVDQSCRQVATVGPPKAHKSRAKPKVGIVGLGAGARHALHPNKR